MSKNNKQKAAVKTVEKVEKQPAVAKQEPVKEPVPSPKPAPKDPVKEPKKEETPRPVKQPKKEKVEAEVLIPETAVPKSVTHPQKLRMSPDKMVDFVNYMDNTYVKNSSPNDALVHASNQIMSTYLLKIVQLQIEEDSPLLQLNIPSDMLSVFDKAAQGLQVAMKVLPAAPTADKSQLQLQFEENTIPQPLKEQQQKDEKTAAAVVKTDPTLDYSDDELKQTILYFLTRYGNKEEDKEKSTKSVGETVDWFVSYSVAHSASEDHKKAILETPKTQWFNYILSLIKDEIPNNLNGIMQQIYKAYVDDTTILRPHCIAKKMSPTWGDDEIRRMVEHIVNKMAGVDNNFIFAPEKKVGESFIEDLLQNKGRTFDLFVRTYPEVKEEKEIKFEKAGAKMEDIFNLYISQKDQAARLSRYSDKGYHGKKKN